MAFIIVEQGPSKGGKCIIGSKGVTIGRAEGNEIRVRDKTVSRFHCRVLPENDGYVVQDLESQNATRVNRRRVTFSRLNDGDEIILGCSVLRFLVADPEASEEDESKTGVTLVEGRKAIAAPPDEVGFESENESGARSPFEVETLNVISQAENSLHRLQEIVKISLVRLARDLKATRVDFWPPREPQRKNSPWRKVGGIANADFPHGLEYTTEGTSIEIPVFSTSVYEHATKGKEGVLCRSVCTDRRFSKSGSLLDNQVETFVAAPLFVGEVLYGVLCAVSIGTDRRFLTTDLEVLCSVSKHLSAVFHRCEVINSLTQENNQMQRAMAIERRDLIGSSPAMIKVRECIQRAAKSELTVLIRGENGTGKELVARAIHFAGSRNRGPIVTLNCAGIAEGLIESELFGHEKGAFTGATVRKDGYFQQADRGTLFLDEIGDMDLRCQASLLRVLQDGTFQRVGGRETINVDVRVIAATNRALENQIDAGKFREDLYYRLNVLELAVPPLRSRKEDIPELVSHFLGECAIKMGRTGIRLSKESLEILSTHDWPGNVRELRNAIERAVTVCSGPEIFRDDLPPFRRHKSVPSEHAIREGLPMSLAELERNHINFVLSWTGGNKKKAAELLGIDRSTLYEKMRTLNPEG